MYDIMLRMQSHAIAYKHTLVYYIVLCYIVLQQTALARCCARIRNSSWTGAAVKGGGAGGWPAAGRALPPARPEDARPPASRL